MIKLKDRLTIYKEFLLEYTPQQDFFTGEYLENNEVIAVKAIDSKAIESNGIYNYVLTSRRNDFLDEIILLPEDIEDLKLRNEVLLGELKRFNLPKDQIFINQLMFERSKNILNSLFEESSCNNGIDPNFIDISSGYMSLKTLLN